MKKIIESYKPNELLEKLTDEIKDLIEHVSVEKLPHTDKHIISEVHNLIIKVEVHDSYCED